MAKTQKNFKSIFLTVLGSLITGVLLTFASHLHNQKQKYYNVKSDKILVYYENNYGWPLVYQHNKVSSDFSLASTLDFNCSDALSIGVPCGEAFNGFPPDNFITVNANSYPLKILPYQFIFDVLIYGVVTALVITLIYNAKGFKRGHTSSK